MARLNNSEEILESVNLLRDLIEGHRGTPQEKRLQMLLTLKTAPFMTLGEVARRLDQSERNVQRWWSRYRNGGREELLAMGERGRPRKLEESQVEELRGVLQRQGVGVTSEAQRLIKEQFGVTYSRTGIWNLLKTAVNATPRGWVVVDTPGSPRTANSLPPGSSPLAISQIVDFLNNLPTSSSDIVKSITTFCEALRNILGDVDRISVSVNTSFDLAGSKNDRSGPIIIQNVQNVEIGSTEAHEHPGLALLESFKANNFPFDRYHPPHTNDYYFRGEWFLGTIIFWRELEQDPISDSTLQNISILENFFVFMLSDIVARQQAENPTEVFFHEAVGEMAEKSGLSPQEQRVVLLQLLGHSYKDMAENLSVSVDTIKKHFQTIHRKTGTKGQSELFAKFFSSRLRPREEI